MFVQAFGTYSPEGPTLSAWSCRMTFAVAPATTAVFEPDPGACGDLVLPRVAGRATDWDEADHRLPDRGVVRVT